MIIISILKILVIITLILTILYYQSRLYNEIHKNQIEIMKMLKKLLDEDKVIEDKIDETNNKS